MLDWADTSMESGVHQRMWQAVLGCAVDMRRKLLVRCPITWNITRHDGPDHLGL